MSGENLTNKAEQKPEKPQKPEVRINGVLYRLRFDLGALEDVTNEYGGIKEAFRELTGSGMVRAVRKLFRICANCQRDYDGMPTDVTDDAIGRHTSLAKITEISDAIQAAMKEGMRSETASEGEEEPQDALAEEYEEKNSAAGGQPVSGSSTDTH